MGEPGKPSETDRREAYELAKGILESIRNDESGLNALMLQVEHELISNVDARELERRVWLLASTLVWVVSESIGADEYDLLAGYRAAGG